MEEIEKLIDDRVDTLETLTVSTVTNNDSDFSILERYGEDLTAKTFITNPAIGRDNEINEMILALITPDKGALLTG